MQAVILVGGEGTRLRPLTSRQPKPVITLVDRPFLVYMLEWLRGHGVDDVILACGFEPTKVEAALGDGSSLGIRLRYVVEPEPRGTAGALKFCEDLLEERFLMLNGDVLTDADVTAQIAAHEAAGATGTLGLVPVEDPSAYGLVLCDEGGAVTGFLEKPGPDELVGVRKYLISAGIYVLERSVLGRRRVGVLDGHRDARALPAGDLRHPRGQRQDGGARAAGRRLPGGRRRRPRRRAHRAARGRRPGLHDRGGRARRQPGRPRARGAGRRARPRGALRGARRRPDRRPLRAHGLRRGGRRGAGRRHRGTRRGRRRGGCTGRRGQRARPRDQGVPRHGAAGRGDQVLRRGSCAVTTTNAELDRDGIARVDSTDQLTDVLAIPEHLRDAVWKVESAQLEDWDSPAGMVVAGMGGSAIGGALARVILGDTASRPILSSRAYGLPGWTTPDTTVLVASYSGDTEEALACYEAAGFLGATRVVATSGGTLAEDARRDGVPVIPIAGGLQPRAAVAYMTVAVLEVAARCGAGPRITSDIDVAAEHLEELVTLWGPEAPDDSEAKTLARDLHGTIPVISGAGVTAPIAYRWKTQLNENAEVPAFWNELPELDPNELVGWGGAAELGRFAAVFLEDSDTHPRVADRVELTCGLIREQAASTHRVQSRGQTAFERAFSLVLLGDLVSVYLAVLRGVDPGPVAVIDRLKQELAER
ncbi:MAG: bifunctional phosphoglucose/phosphomannose isomerase [Solirubrobacterales bacterium]|nr:bifunctional phosphoglucose/phosphomannose isomerase [Solirubrobacterales bacterium]